MKVEIIAVRSTDIIARRVDNGEEVTIQVDSKDRADAPEIVRDALRLANGQPIFFELRLVQ